MTIILISLTAAYNEKCDATSMPGIKKIASTKKKELMQINCPNCKPNPTVTVAEIILINVQQNNKGKKIKVSLKTTNRNDLIIPKICYIIKLPKFVFFINPINTGQRLCPTLERPGCLRSTHKLQFSQCRVKPHLKKAQRRPLWSARPRHNLRANWQRGLKELCWECIYHG